MSDVNDEKIMGIVPKARYMYFAYMFLLVSAAGNAFYSLLSIVGLRMESAGYAVMILGLLAAVLAGIGLTKNKADFSELDHAHFKFIIFLFVVFFVINILGGGVYALSYTLGYIVTAMIGALNAVLAWTGYNSWQAGRVLTKENIKGEVQIAIKNR